MPKEPEQEPIQQTEQGYEIPVPKRGDVLGNLAKVARPERKLRRRRNGRAQKQR